MKNLWTMPIEAIIKKFNTDSENGLSFANVSENRKKFGNNAVEEIKGARALELIIDGVREPMMMVLLVIAGLSVVFGKTTEAMVMVFVVMIYIAVEFVNKYRTDLTMTGLRKLTSPTAKVIRDGKYQEVRTADIVCGDILILTEGACIPADARLVESFGLLVNEASLTGESLPVEKRADAVLGAEVPLAERRTMVFSGTIVLNGEGKSVVVAVGVESEFGKIAQAVAKTEKEKTVLQESMTRLAKILAIFAIGISILISTVGFLRGLNLQEMIITWLALTFLMVPGQPPIIITMALALASFKLANIKLVVKRLHGVESLSQVTTIVTDKTGTITKNSMIVDYFIMPNGEKILPKNMVSELKRSILYALPRYGNDPTDEAVRVAVKDSLEVAAPVSFSGFSEHQPWRTIEYQTNGERIIYIAGKMESVLELCAMTKNQKINHLIQEAAEEGKRIVAYARSVNSKEPQCSLLALAVLSDPIRDGVAQTIAILDDAEIKTFMVTGDYPATTRAIAMQLHITTEIITGSELEKMGDSELETTLKDTNIFARIVPLQKLRIVEALKRNGEIVAVIGDGVNDAPSLKAAHVGIAMGETGTDLAKETADLVLVDDNYTHIADAIRISRAALDNFRKGLTYYLTAKCILVVIFLNSLIFGIPFPFAPIHIILTELLMDLASSTIFVTEAAEPDVLKRGVRAFKNFLGKQLICAVIRNGAALAIGISVLYVAVYFKTGNVVLAQTTAFVTWLLGHVALALNLKQEQLLLFKQGLFANRFGAGWLFGIIFISVVITSVPALHVYFKTSALSIGLWLAIITVAISSTFWIEVAKLVRLRRAQL